MSRTLRKSRELEDHRFRVVRNKPDGKHRRRCDCSWCTDKRTHKHKRRDTFFRHKIWDKEGFLEVIDTEDLWITF